MDRGGWASEQLTAFLAALSSATDAKVLAQRAVDLAAEAVEAEAAAFLEAGVVRSVIGWPAGGAPAMTLAELTAASGETRELPDLGACRIFAATVDEDEQRVLMVARIGDTAFSYEERNLLRAMSRVLSLSLRSCERLHHERTLRDDSERQASEYRQLIRAIEERQALLERLTRIQRSISTGAPLEQVLHTIAAGAKELLRCDVVTVRRLTDEETAVIVASDGADPHAPIAQMIGLDTGISGQSIKEQRLIVAHDYQSDERSHESTRARGIRAGMATPVREYGVVVGCLTVGSCEPGRQFSEAEQETLVSFAAHASLAISEARSADALRRALHDAQHDAMHDPLTGLPNRALLRMRLDQVAQGRRHDDGAVALLFLDLDNFKHINDSLGHDVGDALLVAVARRLTDEIRPSDTIARLGGDEFAVLVEGLGADTDIEQVAERLRVTLSTPVSIDDRDLDVGASIGIAVWNGQDDIHSLLRSADLAMYEAKRAGGGRYTLFHPEMHSRTLLRLNLEHDLRRAVTDGQIRVNYQPVVDLATNRITGIEALARWEHPERGVVSPAEFIPVAEATQLIHAVSEAVLRQACAAARDWPDDVRLSVNLSPCQIGPDLPRRISRLVREEGFDAHRMTVEVTEGVAMMDSPEMAFIFAQLNELGFSIAIDDFGTGYSSLGRLRQLPVDTLKIDRSFVTDLDTKEGVAIIGAIFALSRAAELTTIAEGVETAEQLAALRMLGCDHVQGYLIGRPMTAAAVRELLEQRTASTLHPAALAGPDAFVAPDFPTDVLVFRRVAPGRYAHIGGRGRGSGWAGIVELTDGTSDIGVQLPASPGQVVRYSSAAPQQIVGPYWARDAALVAVDHDLIAVLADADADMTPLIDSELRALALSHVRALTAVSPAKRLSDELEVYEAVRRVTTVVAQDVPTIMRHIADSAVDALSCEVAIIVLADGRFEMVTRCGFEPRDPADRVAKSVLAIAEDVDGFICTQNAARWAGPLSSLDRIASWSMARLPSVDGALFVAHSELRPRGFTTLCQRLARELAAAAQTPLHVALLREVLHDVPEPRATTDTSVTSGAA